MRRILFLASTFLILQDGIAQLPEDVMKYGWMQGSGSARQLAVGGATTALGGEIGATFTNPAGLGLYKNSEMVLSPGFSFMGSNANFRGTTAQADALNKFNFGTSGFVFGGPTPNTKWTSKAFSIAVNRTANFNSSQYFKGQNNYSSFAEPLANEFSNSNLTIDQALNSNSISLLTKMALYTYLVDTATIGGRKQVIARSEEPSMLQQELKTYTTGGITELAFGFATNMDDKVYVGFSVGIPMVQYQRKTQWKEEDATGYGNNEFSYARYNETYTSKGTGVNLKMGAIFKPSERIRIGVAIHTPSFLGLTDQVEASMTTHIDTAVGTIKEFTVNNKTLNNGADIQYKYDLNTPLKMMAGISYVLHEVEDVTKQRGFLTADVEYVSHGMPRYAAADNLAANQDYANENEAIRNYYKGAFNVRVGGELKFHTIMTRLGFAYFGSPYEDKSLKAHRMNISGGVGYRDHGYFIDLTYVHAIQNNVSFPYRVDYPRLNTYADVKDRIGNVMLTFGVKL